MSSNAEKSPPPSAETRSLMTDARERSLTPLPDPDPDGDFITIEMRGKPVRVHRESTTHWTRYHDAPDHEWKRWGISYVDDPGGKLVRR